MAGLVNAHLAVSSAAVVTDSDLHCTGIVAGRIAHAQTYRLAEPRRLEFLW